jgi:transketolase
MSDPRQLANAIRFLSIDAVQEAKSGHPGMPMGMADIAEVLWRDYLQHSPSNPRWMNRDRFVLSNGHGSMLLYSLLHLTGYDLSIDDIKQFRQLHSKTPGHPEVDEVPGVETTTGPLGQGIANAVGMALAEQKLAKEFNQAGHDIVDHHTYVFMGDGCLMEGISHEVCSLAGTWGLGKLIAFWDDNGISIDGDVKGWFTDDTPMRFESYGWQVIKDVDGHDRAAIARAIEEAQRDTNKPTLICCKTTIGFGSPNKAGTAGVHGAPLGDDEIARVREELDWPHPAFEIPEAISAEWDAKEKGKALELNWRDQWKSYQDAHPDLSDELRRRIEGKLPNDFDAVMEKVMSTVNGEAKSLATRKAQQVCLDLFAEHCPELLGGSADLTGSNGTIWKDANAENYIHYGVREFGMSAIMNGLALHGGFIPFSGTFLTFSDYARNAVRMSALMKQRVIYVYSHDSIGLGEDGPTHQAVEHTASLRLIPGLSVWRPCDTVETAVAWQESMGYQGPSALLLTRQTIEFQSRTQAQLDAVKRGGYVLFEPEHALEGLIIATGSEVEIAVKAAKQLAEKGKGVRVVSMPCVELFLQQDKAYQDDVLPLVITQRVAIEAGVTDGWYRFVGTEGTVIGLDEFGASAPGDVLYEHFGMTVEAIVTSF